MNRRRFAATTGAATLATVFAHSQEKPTPKQFHLWAIGDAHVGADIARKRESLADAIRQSEQGGNDDAPPFDWDIAINVGDFSGNHDASAA